MTPTLLTAAEFYVDPMHGSMSNDGTLAHPWSTLQEVLEQNKIETRKWQDHPYLPGMPFVPKNQGAPVKAGDTLVLMDGFHGKIDITEYYNESYITLTAMPGHTPALSLSEICSGCKWILKGLTFTPELAPAYETGYLLKFVNSNWTGPCSDCIVEDCLLYSVWDTVSWSETDWNNKACDGIALPGEQMVIRNCHLKNVDMGIYVTGDNCLVEDTVVENFSGDGLRGLGDYNTFQHNTVKNSYDVNNNHDDGFQSWSLGPDGVVGHGTVYGIVLRGNTIIAYEDPAQPFRGTLQGIGCFDGMFEDWIVENNVIITDHWHGITLLGAVNCRVVNNTVIDPNTTSPGPPWIRIAEHKNGTPCSGCTVRNNLVTDLNNAVQGVQEDHNIIVEEYNDFFIDAAGMDLRLRQGCMAIDEGYEVLAPSTDRDQIQRPTGPGWDIGAYEYHGVVKGKDDLRMVNSMSSKTPVLRIE
ncbi:MAG: choice-of-anchor Q domain-containing protein [Planctomycetota bacterium]